MPAYHLGRDTASRGSGSRGWGYHAYAYAGATVTRSGGPVASLAWSGHTGFSFSIGDTERYLLQADGTTRNTILVSGNTSTSLRHAITLSSTPWLLLSIYCWSTDAWTQAIELRRPSDSTLLASADTEDYSLGRWYRFRFNESVNVQFSLLTGSRTYVAGVYVDPYPTNFAGAVPRTAIGDLAL